MISVDSGCSAVTADGDGAGTAADAAGAEEDSAGAIVVAAKPD